MKRGETLVAGSATRETERGVRRAEPREHFCNVDALAPDLEGFGGGALGASGGPRFEGEGALGEQVTRKRENVGSCGDHGRLDGAR